MFLPSLRRGTAAATVLKQSQWRLSIWRSLALTNPAKPIPTKSKKPKSRFDTKEMTEEIQATDPLFSVKEEAELRRRQLAEDERNPALDVGPNGRPVFSSAPSIPLRTKDDVNTYVKFRMEEWKEMLPEGLPMGMVKEFETSSRSALLVRKSFIDLRDNFMRAADPLFVLNNEAPKVRKQIVLDGPLSCGKSIALAMLVHWARQEGWLVLYVPRGKDWTHGGLVYGIHLCKPQTFCRFLKYNKPCLQGLKCNMHDPIPLGGVLVLGGQKVVNKCKFQKMQLFLSLFKLE